MEKIARSITLLAGFLALGLGAVGIFVPLLPTTPLVLLAVWLFGRSSAKYYAWLRNNRLFGKILRDWEEHRGLSIADKRRMVILSVIIIGISFIVCPDLIGRIALGLVLLIPISIVIFTRTIR
ncbi:MAG TPA: DUF454 family protein [bacterium]|jgi:uncharacterized membrane protein YbaN (DUF454 family)